MPRLVSSRLRSSTDVTVDEATLWHQMQTVHARRHLCSCCSCFSFFHPLTLSLSLAHSSCIGFVCCSYLCADFAATFCLIFFFFSFFCVCKAQKPKSLRNIARDKQSQKRQVSLASLFPLLSVRPLAAAFTCVANSSYFALNLAFFHCSISDVNENSALTSFFKAEK